MRSSHVSAVRNMNAVIAVYCSGADEHTHKLFPNVF